MAEQTVFVTGGTRGIGLATVHALRADGYHVVAVGRSPATQLRDAEFLAADLATLRGQNVVADRIRGCRTLYGLVNNAGVATGRLHVVADRDSLNRMWAVNLEAPMVLAAAAAKAMRGNQRGRIVNITSVAAERPYRGLAGYAATKAGLEAFSRVLALEVGPWGITVNCVAPGFVDTAMTADLPPDVTARIRHRTAIPRPLSADDVARTVRFVLSPDADALTARTFTVDGGSSA